MTSHRSAVTGKFVTAEHAAANPDTTVSESPCAACERLRSVVRGIRAYCEAFVEESEDHDPEPWNPAAYVLSILDGADVTPADGQPVVRTVGDLTARHIGKLVRVEGCGYTLDHIGPSKCLFILGPGGYFPGQQFPLDTPCEVLP